MKVMWSFLLSKVLWAGISAVIERERSYQSQIFRDLFWVATNSIRFSSSHRISSDFRSNLRLHETASFCDIVSHSV